MNTCASCKFFRPDPRDWTAPFGTCQRLCHTGTRSSDIHRWESEHGESEDWWTDGQWMVACHPDTLAYTADASGYASTLAVHPDFGCIHHDLLDKERT